ALVVDRDGDLLPPRHGGFEGGAVGSGGSRGRSRDGGLGRGQQRGEESKHGLLSFVPALCPLGMKPTRAGTGSKGLDSLSAWPCDTQPARECSQCSWSWDARSGSQKSQKVAPLRTRRMRTRAREGALARDGVK